MISIGIVGIVVIIFSFIGAILQITDKNKKAVGAGKEKDKKDYDSDEETNR